ncbi:unnamed protein product [Toxocara canis]|uniref:inositol-phosphate phosphatase n=1 Tax=Toxocara canis TaxID=6265 RepID=A0A183V3Q0_TOXCA|nr:unnamed protein product [Toxocara canis]
MHIRVNLKNLTIFCILCAFSFIGYVILSSGERFPDVGVELRDVISYAVLAVEIGGRAITRVHEERSLGIVKKGKTAEGRDEFLTKADLASNSLILDTFKRFPGIYVVTEEKDSHLRDEDLQNYRADNYEVWLGVKETIDKLPSKKVKLSKLTVWVDPLDATQEFSEGLLEYVTVMVCIALDGRPIFGAVYRPFLSETLFGLVGYGVINGNGKRWNSTVLQNVPKKILISRSHAGTVEELVNKTFGDEFTVEAAGGSGYKTLRLINGTAQIYLHRTAISKWDTCAGDALITAIGGAMIDLNGNPIDYRSASNTRIDGGLFVALKNPFTLLKSCLLLTSDQIGETRTMRELEVKLNKVALEKLRIASEYIRLSYELEKMLDNYRFNLSKTKSIIGISNASAAVIDYREMDPTVRIDVDDKGNFSVADSSLTTQSKSSEVTTRKRAGSKDNSEIKGEQEEKPNRMPVFRPFGVLEPSSAKAARNDIARCIRLICHIASVKSELLRVMEQYKALKTELNYVCLPTEMKGSCQVSG